MEKMKNNSLGSWAFILGVVIAIVAGIAAGALGPNASFLAIILVLLGLVVGFLNISAKEVNDFLIAAIALTVLQAANLAAIPMVGAYLASMVMYVVAFVGTAALVVALKAVYNIAKAPKT